MKRSEMVLEMASNLVCNYPKIPFDEAQDIADKMLYVAEQNDMLPPQRPGESPIGYGAAYLDDEDCFKNRFNWKHQWEPEND